MLQYSYRAEKWSLEIRIDAAALWTLIQILSLAVQILNRVV